MPNNLTSLQPTLFSAAREVANEVFAITNSINTNFDDKGVAINDNVSVPVAPVRASQNYVPAMTVAAGTDATSSNVLVTITKNKMVDWNLTGEQLRSLENGTINQDWVSQLMKQGMRTLRNELEQDAALAVKVGASRAFGTAGTNLFASDINNLPELRKVLVDNGAPFADVTLAVDTTGGNALRKLPVIQQAYIAGSDQERRSGVFQQQFGMKIVESAGVASHTKGTGSGYTTTTAGFAVGTTSIPLISGTGTVVAGDVVTFAGDTNKYVVATGVAAPGTITIAEPGLRQAIPAAATGMTIGNNYTANVVYERNAVVGVIRPPLIPENPTITQIPVTDPYGLTYLLVEAAGDGMKTWRLHLAWGFKTVTPMFTAIGLG